MAYAVIEARGTFRDKALIVEVHNDMFAAWRSAQAGQWEVVSTLGGEVVGDAIYGDLIGGDSYRLISQDQIDEARQAAARPARRMTAEEIRRQDYAMAAGRTAAAEMYRLAPGLRRR